MIKKRFRLQDRDVLILKFTKDSRFLCIDQIKRRFWGLATMKAAANRMHDLAGMGLVEHVRIDITRHASHYYLTKKGYEELKGRGLTYDVKEPFMPAPTNLVGATYHHHLRVTNMRIAMEMDKTIKVLKWISETDIRADKEGHNVLESKKRFYEKVKDLKYRIPDAIIKIQDAGDPIDMIFEYEHTKYPRNKFSNYMERWEKNWEDYYKFIVVASHDRAEVLRKWCLEDLGKIRKLDIRLKSKKLSDLSDSYIFTDYESLVGKGLINSGIRTPLYKLELDPIKGR